MNEKFVMTIDSKGCTTRPYTDDQLSLEDLQKWVDGLIEFVNITSLFENPTRQIDMIINDEGKLIGMPINVIASVIATDAGSIGDDVIVGPVVIAACDEEGRTVPLNKDELEQLRRITQWATVKAAQIMVMVHELSGTDGFDE